MRDYGSIQTKFWTHPDVVQLTDQAKLLASYLLSSPHTNMLGCFRIPVGYIAEDLKWSADVTLQALNDLVAIDFLNYDAASGWVLIHNFLKYHPIENPNQGRSISKLFNAIPKSLTFIPILISKLLQQSKHLDETFCSYLQTLSQPFLNQEQDQEQDQDQDQKQEQELMMSDESDIAPTNEFIFKKQNKKELKSQALEVLQFLNEKTGRGYRAVDTNLNFIMSRLSSGVTVGQCFQVIAKKFRDWNKNDEMVTYLRPETLFNKKKFESYLGEINFIQTSEVTQ